MQLSLFSPEKQCEICKTAINAVSYDSLTLKEISDLYGSKTARLTIIPHIADFVMFTNSKDVMGEQSIIQCADVIVTSYGYLKVTEIMLFFFKYKSGDLGNVYGSISPLDITTSLKKFCGVLYSIREKQKDMEMQDKRNRQHEGCVTYEQYQEILKIERERKTGQEL